MITICCQSGEIPNDTKVAEDGVLGLWREYIVKVDEKLKDQRTDVYKNLCTGVVD